MFSRSIIPNEILNLIFAYVEKNKVGILFINPIISWKRYLHHYCDFEEETEHRLSFHIYYFSRYRTVYSKTSFPLSK